MILYQMKIINFAIIAHIDHGKSTLSDCIILKCGGLTEREMQEQVLDSLNVERERGITVKAQAVSLEYTYAQAANDAAELNNTNASSKYILNLIDTPGHVDFNTEVKRSLAACEGVILLVDACKGVQAQTVANVRLAKEKDLYILPVINKIDLPSADPVYVADQIKNILKIPGDPILISSKTKFGIDDLMHAITHKMPIALQNNDQPLKAMIIDSYYDQHLGIVMIVRVYDGSISIKDEISMFSTKKSYRVTSLGLFTPKKKEITTLASGMTGYVIANIKDISECVPGDTIYDKSNSIDAAVPGFSIAKPCVFCGLYPLHKDEYSDLKRALEKLKLNDIGLLIHNSNIPILGSGFRCGFLGLLHMEVIQQRLSEEFNISAVSTSPGVFYNVYTTKGEMVTVEHPTEMPDSTKVDYIAEPWAKVDIFTHSSYTGPIIELCAARRGIERDDHIVQLGDDQIILQYYMPLSEIIYDFHDKLKSLTCGYASFDYELYDYRQSDIVSLRILVQGDEVETLACLIHKSRAETYGRWVCQQLKEAMDRQQFAVAIQAAIGGKIIARETVSAFRKDVTAKCYGGDVTRKKKLLEKQKEGKKRMMRMGNVEVPLHKIRDILSKKSG